MEGDDPPLNAVQRERGWVARRPVGVGSVWRRNDLAVVALKPDPNAAVDDLTAWEREQAIGNLERTGARDELQDLAPSEQAPSGRFETPSNEWVDANGSEWARGAKTAPPVGRTRSPPEMVRQHAPCWPFVAVEVVKRDGEYTVLEHGRNVKPSKLSPSAQRLDRYWRQTYWNEPWWKGDDAEKKRLDDAQAGYLEIVERDREEGTLHYGLNVPPQIKSKDAVYTSPALAGGAEGAVTVTDRAQWDALDGRGEALYEEQLKPADLDMVDQPPVRFAAPLAMRVRVEEHELPPDYARVTTRAVTVSGIGIETGVANAIEDVQLGSFDLPVGSVTAPTSEAAVVPFPMSVPMIPQTAILSREGKRKSIYAQWRNGRFRSDRESGFLSRVVFRPRLPSVYTAIPRLATWVVLIGPRVLLGVYNTARNAVRNYWLRVRPDVDGVEEKLYTYGSPSINVFDDLLNDLELINEELIAGDERARKAAEGAVVDYVLGTTVKSLQDQQGELKTTEVPGPRIENLTGRARQLAEFLFPAMWYDPNPYNDNTEALPDRLPKHIENNYKTAVNAVLNSGILQGVRALARTITWDKVASDPRNLGKLDARTRAHNSASAAGMDALFLSTHRADVRYDIEIGDSQRAEPIRLSVHANEQAGLMAGRAAIDYDTLRKSFDALSARVEELITGWGERIEAQKQIGMLEYVVPGLQNITRSDLANAVRDNLAADDAIEPAAMRSWFRDRAVHNGELTSAEKGVNRLHEKFVIASVRARLNELVNAKFPDSSTPSHLFNPDDDDHTNAENKKYEENKINREMTWPQLSMTNIAKLFIADPVQRKRQGVRWYATQNPPFLNPLTLYGETSGFNDANELLDEDFVPPFPGDKADTFVTFESALLPPQPSWKLDHMRARRATVDPATYERRLPQLVKLKQPSALAGFEPLRDLDPDAHRHIKLLGAVCRRAARFVVAEVRELVENEVEAVHAEQTREPDPAYEPVADGALVAQILARVPARDAGLPRRRRLQFVSFYELPSDDGAERYLVPLPPLYTPPTLPLGAALPDATSRHLHAALSVMFGASFLTMEDVLGAREAVPDVVRSEARNAFASVLVNCLLARANASTGMVAHDAVESVVRQARRIALEASRLIKAVYDVHNAAVIADADELFRTRPEGPATRLVLRHTSGWRPEWGTSRVLLRSAVWRTHVRAFADALAARAQDTTSHPALIPLLNVQSSWLAVRPHGPGPSDYEELREFDELNVHEARRSLARAHALLHVHDQTNEENGGVVMHSLLVFLSVVDLMLARPVLWRIRGSHAEQGDALGAMFERPVASKQGKPPSEEGADAFAAERDADIDVNELPTAPALDDRELRHAWAARRVELPLRLLQAPLDREADALDSALGEVVDTLVKCKLGEGDATRRQRRPAGACTYYVPVCCDAVTDLTQEYDPRTGLQVLYVRSMVGAAEALVRALDDERRNERQPNNANDETLVLRTSVVKNGRIPAHPLFITVDSNAANEQRRLTAHVGLMETVDDAALDAATSAIFGRTDRVTKLAGLRTLKFAMQGLDSAALRQTQRVCVARDERVDRLCATLADARRTLTLATDRVYQALLHVRMSRKERGRQMRLNIRVNDLQITEATAPGDGADSDPGELFGTRNSTVAARKSNCRMIVVAALLAQSLFPATENLRVHFEDLNDDTLVRSAATFYKGYAKALKTMGAHIVPLSELVSVSAAMLVRAAA